MALGFRQTRALSAREGAKNVGWMTEGIDSTRPNLTLNTFSQGRAPRSEWLALIDNRRHVFPHSSPTSASFLSHDMSRLAAGPFRPDIGPHRTCLSSCPWSSPRKLRCSTWNMTAQTRLIRVQNHYRPILGRAHRAMMLRTVQKMDWKKLH